MSRNFQIKKKLIGQLPIQYDKQNELTVEEQYEQTQKPHRSESRHVCSGRSD